MASPVLEITLLGGFGARLAGAPLALSTRKAQALLAYLAVRPGARHTRAKLAALLWGERSDDQARNSLRQTLFQVRGALEAVASRCLVEESGSLALAPHAVDVDVAAFERLAEDPSPAALEGAVALYRGDLLEGLDLREAAFDEWLLPERERLRDRALEALARLLAHQMQEHADDVAIRTATRLLALDALQEPVHRALMRLYARGGERAKALRQYQLCTAALQRELGVEAEAATKALYREALQGTDPGAEEALVLLPAGRRAGPNGRGAEGTLVGRDRELTRLREALAGAAAGKGRIATVLGEAGIGKTRLVEELVDIARAEGVRVVVGHCYEAEQGLPFRPWTEALRGGGLITDADLLDDLGATWTAELAILFPELGPRAPARPVESSLRVFEALARLLDRAVSRQPLLVVLEDLHWADETSLKLLSFVSRRMEPWRALIVATARHEDLVDVPVLARLLDSLDRQDRLVRVGLGPLTEAETAALVRALTHAADSPGLAARVRQIWAMSAGNPLVTVEATRSAREREGLGGDAPLLLPERVRALIAGRLERLDEGTRHLVAVAAVIGRACDFALLAEAAGVSEETAAARVETLVARGLLHAVGEQLDFTHVRIRQVAHDGLLAPRRRLLHRAIARALGEMYRHDLEPHRLALGHHYFAAEEWEPALHHLAAAGHAAMDRAAYREAAACFEQARVATQRLPPAIDLGTLAIDLRFALRQAWNVLGEIGRTIPVLREAETLAAGKDDHVRLGWSLAFLCNALSIVGDHPGAVTAGERALALADGAGSLPLRTATAIYLGQVHYARGDYARARGLLQAVLEALAGDLERERFGLRFPAGTLARTLLAATLAEIGDIGDAMTLAGEALVVADELEEPWALAHAAFATFAAHVRGGDPGPATQVLRRVATLLQAQDVPMGVALVAPLLGYTLARDGRVDEALALLEPGERLVFPYFLTFLAEAYLRASRVDEARDAARRARALCERRGERGWMAWAVWQLGEIAARGTPSDVEDAERAYRAAHDLARELGMRPLVAACDAGLAALSTTRGGDPRAAARRPRPLDH